MTDNYFKVCRGLRIIELFFFDSGDAGETQAAYESAVDLHRETKDARLCVFRQLRAPWSDVPEVGEWICPTCSGGVDACGCKSANKAA